MEKSKCKLYKAESTLIYQRQHTQLHEYKFYEAIPKGQERNMNLPAVQAVAYCNKLFRYEIEYKEKNLL